ncbi:DUF4295 family protein [Chitinophaga sp. YIM B06452]|uniref:DUF4295 family protein n=1 Tax=Chitinophaga sp. YIM B06452 TaxID=3082158 RepID=UPI0031FEDBB2
MAKQTSKNAKVKDTKAAADAKVWTKVIRAVRSPKSGAYTFKDAIVHKDKVQDFINQK